MFITVDSDIYTFLQQSGTLPIWVTISRLPKQVTLNMNISQQLPKGATLFHKHVTFCMPSVFHSCKLFSLRKKVHKDMILNFCMIKKLTK